MSGWLGRLHLPNHGDPVRVEPVSTPLRRADLDPFVAAYNPVNRHDRQETERFHAFTYDELVARDKASLDLFWLKDDSLEDADALPAPDVLAAEIVEGLRAALEGFAAVAEALEEPAPA